MIKFETRFEREAWVLFAANAISRGTRTESDHAASHADNLLIEMRKRDELIKKHTDSVYKEGEANG